eukprot:60153-Chlamydomonas_euryale.AAC.1
MGEAGLPPALQSYPPPLGVYDGPGATHDVMQSLSLDEVFDGDLDGDLPLMGQIGGGGGAGGYGGSAGAHVPRIDRADADSELEHFYTELAREPAQVELVGKDHLVLTAPALPGALGGIPRGLAPRTPLPPTSSAPPAWQTPHPAASAPRNPLLRASGVAGTTPHVGTPLVAGTGGAATTSSFEVVMPLGELLAEVAAASAAAAAADGEGAAHAAGPLSPSEAHGGSAGLLPTSMLSVLADQVASTMEAKAGVAAPTEEIADALHELLRRAATGEPPSA